MSFKQTLGISTDNKLKEYNASDLPKHFKTYKSWKALLRSNFSIISYFTNQFYFHKLFSFRLNKEDTPEELFMVLSNGSIPANINWCSLFSGQLLSDYRIIFSYGNFSIITSWSEWYLPGYLKLSLETHDSICNSWTNYFSILPTFIHSNIRTNGFTLLMISAA